MTATTAAGRILEVSVLRNEPSPMMMGQPAGVQEDAGGAVFDFEDLQALREEYEERIRRLEREKEAALDVVRKDAGQRITALRAEQDARLHAEGQMRQELIEELTVELAQAREDGERVARDAERRRLASEEKLRWALGEVDRLGNELLRVREVLVAHLTPPLPVAEPAAPPPVPVDDEAPASQPPVASGAATWAAKRKKIRLR